ncbi:ACP S-malonyltransferase [Alkaliphilus transvaalensis]|uniref:ACP S-malonyltransferase n=1 Tax=Alkaliphilus transvaalensis TaxID=114628 RepID=UPI000B1110BD|nr:ACP S-malonyltransferase [Alkaliphilus transvaalensis]
MEKVAFVFPGQGSQYVGMQNKNYNTYPIVRRTFEEANDTLGYDLAKLCFEGSLAELSKMENSLVALLVSSVAAYRVYIEEIGIPPYFLAGHSLGEYSALTCSGAIDFSDAIKIVKHRSLLAVEGNEKWDGIMTIVDGGEIKEIEAQCEKLRKKGRQVWICCYNASNQVNVAGYSQDIIELEDQLMNKGLNITPLLTSAPFHSPLMKEAAETFSLYLKQFKFNDFKYPVISNVTARPYRDKNKIIEQLTRHLIEPVRWREVINYLQKMGVTSILELGSKNVLTGLLNTQKTEMKGYSFDNLPERKELMEIMKADVSNATPMLTVIGKCLSAVATTRNFNPAIADYKKEVTEKYNRIQTLYLDTEAKKIKPTYEQCLKAILILEDILKVKQVPHEEGEEILKEIARDARHIAELQKRINEKEEASINNIKEVG